MSEKGLKALLVATAALVGIWVLVNFLPRGGGGGEAAAELGSFFQGVTAEGVTEVRFGEPGAGDPVRLSRTGADWRVNGFRADSGVVARFWESAADAGIGELVGANPANHGRMGLTADSAWTLEVDVGGETRRLLVGKGGSRYGTAYVRAPDQDEVFLLEGNLRPNLTRNLDDWRNKRMASLDTAQVNRIELEGEGEALALERSDSLWVLVGGGDAEAMPVRNVLSELARLDATGFFQGTDSLTARGGMVRALGQAGDTLLVLELGSGEGDRWARVAGDSIVYKVTSWRADRLLPDPEDLRGGG